MAFIASAAIGGGLSALGGIAGGIIQGNAANDAAAMQAAAANHAADLQKQMYDQTRSDWQPWRQAGVNALGQMQDPYFQHDFGMADFQADPGYAFRLQQGQQALERSAAARGGLMTGGMMKELTNYGQGMGSQEYQNAYNRFTNNQTNRFNRLASLAGGGQNAVAQTQQAGQNYANQAGEDYMGAANAQAGAKTSNGQMWGHMLSGLGSSMGSGFMQAQQMGQMNNWLNKLSPGGGGGSYGPQAMIGGSGIDTSLNPSTMLPYA